MNQHYNRFKEYKNLKPESNQEENYYKKDTMQDLN